MSQAMSEEIHRIYNPRFSQPVLKAKRIIADAEDRAATIVDRAEAKALGIVATANGEAGSIITAAHGEAAAIMAAARNHVAGNQCISPDMPDRRSVKEIIAEVAAAHRMTFADLVGPSRSKPVVAARQQAMQLARLERPDMTLPQLGRVFDRDHTTILHALKKGGPA